jgi:hypothetical protein
MSNSPTHELKLARGRVIDVLGRGWTQDALARNVDDLIVGVASPEAVSWCLTGAFKRVECELQAVVGAYVGEPYHDAAPWAFDALNGLYDRTWRLAERRGYGGVIDANDAMATAEDVTAFMREVI